MSTVCSESRFAGSVLGQCLGDAFGFTVEGQPPEICAAYVATIRAGQRRGRAHFEFGQYTDDSQLMRELLISWVERGGFDPADYAQRVARVFTENTIVGRGRATEQAAHRIATGVPWDQAGTPPPNAGNGSAMRAGVVGLLADDDDLVRVAVDQGRVTHQDPRCSAGAVAIAAATRAYAFDCPSDQLLARILPAVTSVDQGFAKELANLSTWAALPPVEAVAHISRAGLAPDFKDGWRGISPFVVGSVLWSVYCALRHPDDFMAAICEAIAVGGDVDTTAAMTGAIVGARVGVDALPAADVAAINDQGRWTASELRALITRALG